MAVSPADVKKLRDKTLAGMLDCKNALVEANGDFAEAEKILKKKGLASADKRAGRSTDAGAVFTSIVGSTAAAIELNCETDFVAKNAVFSDNGKKIAAYVAENKVSEVNAGVEELVKETISILKENMGVKRISTMEVSDSDCVVDYLHNNGQIGVMVKLSCDSAETAAKDEVKALGMDLALHAAAFNPSYLNRDAVDASYLADQEDIFKGQAATLDKPEKVIAGIIKGKLNKHLSQICFVDQAFVKNDKLSCAQACNEVAKAVGGKIELSEYIYMMVGQEA
ncbi:MULTISPECIES: translation elongation factor Ts [unclassified Oceanispirochaeta]|uniref:translation elongation factor Ts n=1 Tax=unclassified Oceanispirochaeta TaxID=2635722 RepID=UPI000E097F6E|nr:MULTISPECIES: translation elongation factor Ts [unclassified Oceanispirochaeta]MBF9017203.1 translation elongation factor Ts [Oceanispirochaeta sp. M2]NPD73652.1 translation elongation factor Ts [Oceanispirochaeta sp. M1]RDG30582.1 translation elongation factor Ts [Oceanispirochaeta sp. M1]